MQKKHQILFKYFIDKLLSLIMLILLFPFFLIISLLIKMDDKGPVFFKQTRLGLGEKPFVIWKFRTMFVNADSFLDSSGNVSNINRITRIGRILRFLSLDELPQLINILKGEMSFIGPRPVLVDHVARYNEQQRRRFAMKPGVTGLAQVNGRNNLPWSKRIEFDIQYIENYSLWLDIKILIKTVLVVLLRKDIVIDRNPEQVDDLPSKKVM